MRDGAPTPPLPTYPQAALDTLAVYHITAEMMDDWSSQLGLHIPVDHQTNERQISQAHINLFKNVQKHLALGKSIADIRNLVALPENSNISPSNGRSELVAAKTTTAYVSTPESLKLADYRSNGQYGGLGHTGTLAELLDKTIREKDDLQARLMETEKLNSHLYNANNLYHRKVRQLGEQMSQSEAQENRYFKLLDDKSRLQAQLLEAEKTSQQARQQLAEVQRHASQQRQQLEGTIESLQRQVKYLQQELGGTSDGITGHLPASGDIFTGVWNETATLLEVRYDQYGIELDANRQRTFKISSPPQQRIGAMAMINTQYAYENNASWHRQETLILSPNGMEKLEGVLEMTFWMNDTAMASALYRVESTRQK
jgi:DNA repair exonuclease SbcCD ATPase subunit